MTDEPIDDILLARYLAGECSPAERARIDAWVATDAGARESLDALRRRWELAGAVDPSSRATPDEVDAAWARMRDAIDASPAQLAVPSGGADRASPGWAGTRRSGGLWRIAAAILVVAGGAFLVWSINDRVGSPPVATTSAPSMVVATGPGEVRTVRLDDGSTVRLGVASRLEVAADFGTATRSVSLDGEAEFEVTHDAARPFRVQAAHLVAEDLGTRFVVRAYVDELAQARVVVSEGVVAVSRPMLPGTVDTLGAGRMATVPTVGAVQVQAVADTALLLAGTRGTLAFRDAPLARVAAELPRWYGVHVRVESHALATRVVTAGPFTGRALDEVLEVLAVLIAENARIDRRGDTIVFRPR